MQAIITLKDVKKRYQLGKITLEVLKGISLDIFKGEMVTILGPSGSGKSTLMNQVGILDTPTEGQIFLEGEDISTYNETQLALLRGKKIGFVFQQFHLLPTLTALENVMLPAIFQNTPEQERKERAEQLLTRVGLGDRMHHKPSELSGGQQQRVAIARSLINDPDILLADEPTGNLDSTSGKQVMALLSQLHQKENKTIIIVTHDTDLVKFAQRVIYLKDGLLDKVVVKKKPKVSSKKR